MSTSRSNTACSKENYYITPKIKNIYHTHDGNCGHCQLSKAKHSQYFGGWTGHYLHAKWGSGESSILSLLERASLNPWKRDIFLPHIT
jgi:hypothetical protein